MPEPTCGLGFRIEDGNNSSRFVNEGGTLKMVRTDNRARTAKFSLTNTDGYVAASGFPVWTGVTGSGLDASRLFSSDGSVSVKYASTCQDLGGNVEIVNENETEIDFGQYIDLYFSNIADKAEDKFASASKPLTSTSSASFSNDADLTFLSKNADEYMDGSSIARYLKLTGSISYTLGLPKLESPRTPVFGIPVITFYAYFEAKDLTMSGSASMIKDPSVGSEMSGNVTVTGSVAGIEGGVALGVGVADLAEILTTGAMTVDGVSVEGSFNFTQSNITATGTLTIGKVGGKVEISAVYKNSSIKLGEWEDTFITRSEVPLGSKVLYTY